MVDKIKGGLVDFSTAGPLKTNIIVGSSDEVTLGVATHTINSFAATVSNDDRILILDGTHVPTSAISLTETGLTIVSQSNAAIINTDTYTFTSTGENCNIDLNVTDDTNVTLNKSVTTGTFTKIKSEIALSPVEYTPVNVEDGVKKYENGAIYKFDDWEAVDILTGSNAWPVPYKSSLSNVFTGFEVIGYRGNGATIKFDQKYIGLQWHKNREQADAHILYSKLIGKNNYWASDSIAALIEVTTGLHLNEYGDDYYEIGGAASINTLEEEYISWNWHYPLAKAWHASGEASRKVPTPWGIVDSIESNASSGLTGDQVVIELYNPLTGNGCLLYVGTGANRTLDHSGGVAPEFMIVKKLSSTDGALVYHSGCNGGVSPEDYILALNTTAAEIDTVGPWNDIDPTSSLISLGTQGATNGASALLICYYFAPVAGLQAFGGYTGVTGSQTVATGCKDGMWFDKNRGAVSGWPVVDSFRGNDLRLLWNSTVVEGARLAEFDSVSGFDINNDDAEMGANTNTYVYGHFGKEMVIQGDIDVYPTTALTSTSNNDTVIITFEYSGAATLNTELIVYASREGTPNWVQGTLIKLADISDSYDLLQARIDISGNTTGTSMRWRIATSEGGSETQHDIKNLKIEWK